MLKTCAPCVSVPFFWDCRPRTMRRGWPRACSRMASRRVASTRSEYLLKFRLHSRHGCGRYVCKGARTAGAEGSLKKGIAAGRIGSPLRAIYPERHRCSANASAGDGLRVGRRQMGRIEGTEKRIARGERA
jgi:hypothetical protein